MDILRDAAACVARYLSDEAGLDSKERETVRFAVEYFLGFFINLGGIIGIALGLGIVPYVLAAMLTAVLLRLVSGALTVQPIFAALCWGQSFLWALDS